MAEITATEEAAKRGLELAVVVPSMTMGPMLQQALNFSSSHVSRYLTGAKPTYPNAVAAYTDVRDVARAHVLAYERPDARGRYLCIGAVLHRAHFLKLLKDLFPQYSFTAKYERTRWRNPMCLIPCVRRMLTMNILRRCEDDGKPMAKPYKFSNQRLRDLGLKFTPLAESLYETVTCLQKNGHLPLPAPVAPKRAYL
jgi:cinnamoyl-CoA reductase